MTLILFGKEGYANPVIGNKYFFCFKHFSLTREVIESLSSREIEQWRERFDNYKYRGSVSEAMYASQSEYLALVLLVVEDIKSTGNFFQKWAAPATAALLLKTNAEPTAESIRGIFVEIHGKSSSF